MGQAQINVRTRACSGTFIARTKQAALTHNVRGKRLRIFSISMTLFFWPIFHDKICPMLFHDCGNPVTHMM